MRGIRESLAVIIVVGLAVNLLTAIPLAAQTSSGNRGDSVEESSRVGLPDPEGVVTNTAESVRPGFVPPPSGESPCDWKLEVPDDLKGSGVRLNGFGGFRELTGNELAQVRTSLSAAARAYSETGRWWRRSCFDEEGIFVGPSALLPEGNAVTIEELILRSVGTLDPPNPDVTVLPPGKQLVQFPSLFWVEPAYWDAVRTDTQTSGRVSSTVELVPKFSVWDPGDGNRPVECDGPGEVWEEGKDPDNFDCTYTYKTVKGQPFPFTATVQFDIEVVATVGGAPAPGNLGPYEFLERTTEIELGVREIQVVESNG